MTSIWFTIPTMCLTRRFLPLARDGDYESLKTELEDIALNGKEYTITCTIDCSPLKDFIAEGCRKD